MPQPQNIITYVQTVLDPFALRPFTEVDSLVLAQFSYAHLHGLVPAPGEGEPVPLAALCRAEHFAQMFTDILSPENNRLLLYALAASPRWREVRACGYVSVRDEAREQQFAAVTFLLSDGAAYIAYRGTDTTFLGWKEDFNMAFVSPVPSQTEGAAYLADAAARRDGPLRLGGHSKGGNVAVYAAMTAPPALRARIETVYSHDGPGFRHELLDSDGFSAVAGRLQKTLPQSSLVGMLLQSHEPYRIVKSGNVGGVLQHDPFSWTVRGGAFVTEKRLTGGAVFRNTTLDVWLADLPDDKRRVLVEALYAVIEASGAKTFADFQRDWQKDIPAMLKAFAAMDKDTRDTVIDILKALALASVTVLTPGKSPREAAVKE